jgi:hypothetical protein
VFEPDMPFTPFTMINDSTATGQGVNDMKGGDVIMIKALQALHAQGLLDDVTITAYFTGDEERGGEPISVSRADFIERAKLADVAIGFEGATGLNTIAMPEEDQVIGNWKYLLKQGTPLGFLQIELGMVPSMKQLESSMSSELRLVQSNTSHLIQV